MQDVLMLVQFFLMLTATAILIYTSSVVGFNFFRAMYVL
jgi:hypothetical protein